METQPIHFKKQLSLTYGCYEDERLQPPPIVTPPRCLSTEMLATEEDLLQHQLGEFWSFAVDLPNRFLQDVSHLSQQDDSLERQFRYQDYLTKPSLPETPLRRRKVVQPVSIVPDTVLRGEDINDVPCSYVISGLKSHELPVIGTFVDRRILPGYRYRVRLNQSTRYLFEGKSLQLLSIAIGYGKRLTFKANCLNENDNYFWSDSRPEGFAFSVVALEKDDLLEANEDGQSRVIRVLSVLSQKEIETQVRADGDVVKKVRVHLTYVRQETDRDDSSLLELKGVAFLVKPKTSSTSHIEKIELESTSSLRAKELRPPSLYA